MISCSTSSNNCLVIYPHVAFYRQGKTHKPMAGLGTPSKKATDNLTIDHWTVRWKTTTSCWTLKSIHLNVFLLDSRRHNDDRIDSNCDWLRWCCWVFPSLYWASNNRTYNYFDGNITVQRGSGKCR